MKIQEAIILSAFEVTYHLIMLLGSNADMLPECCFIYLLTILQENISLFWSI